MKTKKRIFKVSLLSLSLFAFASVVPFLITSCSQSENSQSNNESINNDSVNNDNSNNNNNSDNNNNNSDESNSEGDNNSPTDTSSNSATVVTNSTGFSEPADASNTENAFLISKNVPKTNNGGETIYSALLGRLVNDRYVNMAKRSVALNFYDGTTPHQGTGWILDYKKTTDNSYPLTWYFATNVHVAWNLVVQNDYNGYNSYFNEEGVVKTVEVSFRNLVEPNTTSEFGHYSNNSSLYNNVKITLATINSDGLTYTYEQNPKVKTVFLGTDFLNSSPSDFNKDESWSGVEEMADFAVFEATFNNETDARNATHDYAEWTENQFKLATPLIDSSVNPIENDYYVMGYPDPQVSGAITGNIQVSINQPNNIDTENLPTTGQSLVKSQFYGTFSKYDANKYGMWDGAIGWPWFNQSNPFTKEKFYYFGLYYGIRHDNLIPGASGSMVMNSNYETLGIQFAYDNTTDYGLSLALSSSGYDYNGEFKWYNHEPYDLVYGGYSNQKNSYKDSLKKIYGSDYVTHLFPGGLA